MKKKVLDSYICGDILLGMKTCTCNMAFILAERTDQCSLKTCFDLWTVEQVATI